MIESIEKKMSTYKSILTKIDGGHSAAIIEFEFYQDKRIDMLFGEINDEKPITNFYSNINWLDFSDEFQTYNGKTRRIDKDDLSRVVMENMQSSWAFNKLYNSSKAAAFPHLEDQINQLIIEAGESITEVSKGVLNCQEKFFDAGGYDYRMILAEFPQGVQIIEFLNFID